MVLSFLVQIFSKLFLPSLLPSICFYQVHCNFPLKISASDTADSPQNAATEFVSHSRLTIRTHCEVVRVPRDDMSVVEHEFADLKGELYFLNG